MSDVASLFVGKRWGWPIATALALMLPIPAQAFPVDLDAPRESPAATYTADIAASANDTGAPAVDRGAALAPSKAPAVLPGLPVGFVARAVDVQSAAATPARPVASVKSPPAVSADRVSTSTSRQETAPDVRTRGEDVVGQILFPLLADVGAAAFRRGDRIFVFFDTTMPIALPPGSGMFTNASATSLPNVEMVSLTISLARNVRLCRVKAGWLLADAALAPCCEAPSIAVAERTGALWFTAVSASKVVRVADPQTGAPLLLGLLTDDRSGQVPNSALATSGAILPSILGVVVSSRTDRLELQRIAAGFRLEPWHDAQPASAQDALASDFTRTLNLPGGSAEAARLRLEAARRLVGTSETAAHAAVLVEAASAAIGAGDGNLATHYAELARLQGVGDGPFGHRVALIEAIAHSLDRRATYGEIPATGQSDEDNAWRDVMAAENGTAQPEQCTELASAMRIFSSYPEPLRHRVLPALAEQVASCGTGPELDTVAHLSDDPALRYAKTLAELRRFGSKAPLDGLDALARDRDPVTAYKAEMRDVSERVARGSMTARQAADRLDTLVFAARMAGDTDTWRSALAGDLTAAGERERALQVLKQARPMTPDLRARARDLMRQIAAERSTQTADRRRNAAILLENTDLLDPISGPADDLRIEVGKTLRADGFPRKALDVLPQADADPDAAGRVRIASARADAALALGEPKTALAALATIRETTAITDQQRSSVILLQARAEEAAGDCGGALQALPGAVDTMHVDSAFQSDADTVAARCMARLGHWVDAVQPLSRLAKRIPAGREALKDADQDIVMRYATAASNAGDQALVNKLVAAYGPRIDPALQSALNALKGSSTDVAAATRIAQLPQQ